MQPRPKLRRLLATAALVVLPLLPLAAAAPALLHRQAAAAGSSAGASAGGLRVALDPATQQRILPEDPHGAVLSAQLRAALRHRADGPTVVLRPDGSKYVNLHGRFMCGIAVRVRDGRAEQFCTTTSHAAAAPPAANTAAAREVR